MNQTTEIILPNNNDTKTKRSVKNSCDVCGKRFFNASKLRYHTISHTTSKDFKCDLCQKLFKFKTSLKRHQRHNHEKLKQHKCMQCMASFAQRINLHVHQQRLHRRRTKYKCKQCDCFFGKLNVLNRHIKASHAKNSNLNVANDANNSLAELVEQLKSLEQGISTVQTKQQSFTRVESEETHETTFVVEAKLGEVSLKVKLNPENTFQIIRVQTVKRSKARLAYVCEYCAKEFYKTYNLIRHLRAHTKERPYDCTVCCSHFYTKTQLRSHVNRMHILDEKTGYLSHQHKCYICCQNFCSMRKLDSHMKSHAESHCVQYHCVVCQKNFGTKTAFSTHKHKTEDKELLTLKTLLPRPITKRISLNTLKLQQGTKQTLLRKLKQNELRKRFKCETYGSCFISNITFRTHLKLHEKQKTFSCTICLNRKFLTKYQNLLGATQQNSLEPIPSTAQLIIKEKNALENCNNTAKFIQIEMLPNVAKFQNRNIQVELADTAATKNTSLEAPTLKTQIAKHTCPHCGKQFQKPSDLVRHSRLHTAERPFNCDKCKKSFKLKSTLDDHHKTHLSPVERNKTKIACQVCGKFYANQKSLNIHLRLHTGNFPFKCEYCNKSFRTSGHHLAHLKAAKSQNGNCINLKNDF